MDKLVVTASLDGSAVGLSADFSVEGFGGHGEGWFNKSEALAFCDQLRRLATEMSGDCELVSSQTIAEGTTSLVRFALRCYVLAPSKLNGIVGLHVTISHYPYTDCRLNEILKVSGELQVRNGQLLVFATALRDLVEGKLDEATILGDLNIL